MTITAWCLPLKRACTATSAAWASPFYNKARFGTKQLIRDYVDSVSDALRHIETLSESEMSLAAKLDLFRRASHCYGRSALMFSAGGTLMYFHFGVAKALLEQGILPRVLSGSSAGAITVSILGTHTDAELEGFFDARNVRFGEEWTPNWFERSTGIRRMFRASSFEPTFDRLIPDLTFREAFELTGRHISISVSPCERHHSPRLLNAMTSPHVLIRSAVRASCAIPGLFEPVQLMARDAQGKTVPYLRSRWIDGLFAADLPAKQLARLYGTNHYIVSMINPMMLPTFRDHKLQSAGLQPLGKAAKAVARSALKSADVYLGKYLPASSWGWSTRSRTTCSHRTMWVTSASRPSADCSRRCACCRPSVMKKSTRWSWLASVRCGRESR